MRNVITTGDVPLGGVLEVLRGTIVTPSARELARDRGVPIFAIFSIFASTAILSVVLVLMIRPRHTEGGPAPISH